MNSPKKTNIYLLINNHAGTIGIQQQIDVIERVFEKLPQFELIRSIKEKVDFVDRVLENPEDARDGASKLIGRIAKEKFKVKPGDGNYIASMTPNGDIHFFHIVLSKLEQDLLDKVSISAGEVKVDFMSIFG